MPDRLATTPHRHRLRADGTCRCGMFPCWCGEWITAEDLESDSLDASCAGTGELNCHCGGDTCVCHLHGEAVCVGCPDCDGEDYDYDDGGGLLTDVDEDDSHPEPWEAC